ncbi:MAG: Organic solvent tolerance protein [Pedosphaera sp.]|nr:Organic solvent tolerance protein [Pedosphaera sp.]
MRTLRVPIALLLLCLGFGPGPALAQLAEPSLEIKGNTNALVYVDTNGMTMSVISNGVTVISTDESGPTIITADKGTWNMTTSDVLFQGSVRVQKGAETWIGEEFEYHFDTKQLDGKHFRMGQAPFYMAGDALHGVGEGTNAVYQGTNAMVTTDDYSQPLLKVRARRFVLVPGKYVEAHDATLYVGKVPVFYFPYYRRSLEQNQNGFSFLPGYRSLYGPYLLSTYNWVLNEQLRGAVHVDLREKRGVGFGPDFDYNFGEYGEGTLRYYYTHDEQPGVDPSIGTPIPADRQRTYFSYTGTPLTNLTILSQVAYQTDPFIIRDFFESQYNRDIQPNTFVDANQLWQNWSLDATAQPRINPFWETVERLPEVRLTGFRQQIGTTPLYYESQSTIGYYGRLFANTNNFGLTNGLGMPVPPPGDFFGSRADTFHQITMPQTFFGWLNFTPRVGGRFTYYGSESGPGGTNSSHDREVFNTGAEVSFTASRLWAGVENQFLDVDGIRHIFQPSVNYVYIPSPNVLPNQLPQFDYELTNSLRLLPIEFPDLNSIDTINRENTIRYGINNRIQTKRNGEIQDLVNWDTYMDWNLRPLTGQPVPAYNQSTFSDIYNDLSLRPRSWLTFNSYTRFSIENGQFNLSQHTLTLQPNTTWNWSLGHLYLRNGPIFGPGDNLYTSIFFYKFNENWGTRIAHYFDASHGTLQEQDYTIYRDLRSWTAALTFRALNNLSNGKDYTVAFTFSFKSFPRFALGQDTVRAATLVGY